MGAKSTLFQRDRTYGGLMQWAYLNLAVLVFIFNLAPAFAPPTWSVLVFFELNFEINPIAIVAIGAVAAGTGRFFLAKGTGLLRERLPKKQRSNLKYAAEVLNRSMSHHLIGLGLFALSPLPSAQMFEAAGLIGMRILPLTLAFFSGRVISYSIYVFSASTLAETNLGQIIRNNLTSPYAIALQILLIYFIYLLTKIDWKKYYKQEKPA